MIVIERDGQTIVITGWRAWLIGAVAVIVVTAVLAALAFLVLGIAVSVVAFLVILMPAVAIWAQMPELLSARGVWGVRTLPRCKKTSDSFPYVSNRHNGRPFRSGRGCRKVVVLAYPPEDSSAVAKSVSRPSGGVL